MTLTRLYKINSLDSGNKTTCRVGFVIYLYPFALDIKYNVTTITATWLLITTQYVDSDHSQAIPKGNIYRHLREEVAKIFRYSGEKKEKKRVKTPPSFFQRVDRFMRTCHRIGKKFQVCSHKTRGTQILLVSPPILDGRGAMLVFDGGEDARSPKVVMVE